MKHGPAVSIALVAIASGGLPAIAQQDMVPWRMHDWGWGGMLLGPLLMLLLLALVIALLVGLFQWLSGDRRGGPDATPTAREILDARYARGEIDREDYLKRRQDISGA